MKKQIVFVIAMIIFVDDVQSMGTSLFKKYTTSNFNSLKTMNNIESMVYFKRINFQFDFNFLRICKGMKENSYIDCHKFS